MRGNARNLWNSRCGTFAGGICLIMCWKEHASLGSDSDGVAVTASHTRGSLRFSVMKWLAVRAAESATWVLFEVCASGEVSRPNRSSVSRNN